MPHPKTGDADAVVIGSGPNGLVAANLLADAGWDVVVLESQGSPGGGLASAKFFGPGWTSDVCSAFFPLAAASPIFEQLQLEDYGVRWLHAGTVLAHPLGGSDAAVIARDVGATCDSLEKLAAGDGGAWRRLHETWRNSGSGVLRAILEPFPPIRAGLRLARQVGLGGGLRLARFASLPVRRLAEEEFTGDGPGLLLAGCAIHADLAPEAALSSFFGWLLAMLAQDVGFPTVEGGASRVADAMVKRLTARGGQVVCDSTVERIEVRAGRAVAAVTSSGERFPARRAILADVSAPALFGGLVSWDDLPSQMRLDAARFQWDWATVKFDWALRSKVPWEAREVAEAGTVHLAETLDSLTQYGADVAMGRIPASPFVLLGQLSTCDPSRSPSGTEALYGYTHVPRVAKRDAGDGSISGSWDRSDCEAMAARVEDRIEQFAPGFKALIQQRHVMAPFDLQAHDRNLDTGAINGGTAELHQQLFFRPVPGLGRSETPIAGLYLASASAHPGGGVHGACGANAARAALALASPGRRYTVVPAIVALERALSRAGPDVGSRVL